MYGDIMFEIEDLGILLALVGTVWCSFVDFYGSVNYINGLNPMFRKAKGKWYYKHLFSFFYEGFYHKKYHIKIGICCMLAGTLIILKY